ncbi:hypothetical protein EYC84_009771 [Monilinia fructicola]|uniref:Uncharacterized protein n=1 Tax=Monilinia fructicola TaxID=38448 RepID=A0A5M9JDP7_MONFR|nr:hypothetical protein EYC84_009771 [Monilinia fructicola]
MGMTMGMTMDHDYRNHHITQHETKLWMNYFYFSYWGFRRFSPPPPPPPPSPINLYRPSTLLRPPLINYICVTIPVV